MKEKNLPDYNNSKSLEELTKEVNSIIEKLEKKEDIKDSLDDYQKLIKLNNIIERKFQIKSKSISKNIKEKINNINSKKNVKKSK
jgi:ribosomal protein L15